MRTNEDAYRPYHTPFCAVEELGDSYRVEIEVPGTPPGDIDLDVGGSSLVITTDARAERSETDARRYYGALELPEDVDAEQAAVTYEFGLLTVVLPKARLVKRRSIRVGADES